MAAPAVRGVEHASITRRRARAYVGAGGGGGCGGGCGGGGVISVSGGAVDAVGVVVGGFASAVRCCEGAVVICCSGCTRINSPRHNLFRDHKAEYKYSGAEE